jgi:hypothetical protein
MGLILVGAVDGIGWSPHDDSVGLLGLIGIQGLQVDAVGTMFPDADGRLLGALWTCRSARR